MRPELLVVRVRVLIDLLTTVAALADDDIATLLSKEAHQALNALVPALAPVAPSEPPAPAAPAPAPGKWSGEPITLEVEVTAHDIATGLSGDPLKCPFARAATRALHRAGYDPKYAVNVGADRASIVGGDPWTLPSASLPLAVRNAIAAYDDGGGLLPMTFTLTFNRSSP